MSASGLFFMVAICSVVWGGFLSLLIWMVASERRKSSSAGESSP